MPISPFLYSLREVVGHRMLLLPGVAAVVFDDVGRVLLGQRSDNGSWALIAGCMDPDEQPAETVVREVYEETGVHVTPERIISVLTHPPNTYPNGDQTQFVCVTFCCRAIGGEARVNDDESLAVGWFGLADLPPINGVDRQRIELASTGGADAWFSAPPAHRP